MRAFSGYMLVLHTSAHSSAQLPPALPFPAPPHLQLEAASCGYRRSQPVLTGVTLCVEQVRPSLLNSLWLGWGLSFLVGMQACIACL